MPNLILEKAGLKDVTCFDIKTHIPILEKTLDIQIFILNLMYKNEFIYKGQPRGTQIYRHSCQNNFDVITLFNRIFVQCVLHLTNTGRRRQRISAQLPFQKS